MVENSIKVGIPNFIPYARTMLGGTGGLCAIGVTTNYATTGAYKYLPFVANGINCTTMDGIDVVSGNFTGCIMAVFTDSGVRKICHISTGTEFGDCKSVWNAIKVNYSNVLEFRPSDFIHGTAFELCYGIITNSVKAFTVLTNCKSVRSPSGARLRTDSIFSKITEVTLLR